LFFGERNHVDPIYDTYVAPGLALEPMGQWGWWAPSGGKYGLSDVTLSTFAPINYRVPLAYGAAGAPSGSTFSDTYEASRVGSFGSQHSGGAQFCLADGSCRFISQNIDFTIFRGLGTRAGSEIIGDF
jgi:hypothetical protein